MIKTLNRNLAPNILRFFDICFKQGVIDACNYHDNYAAADFVAQRKEDWHFGILGEPDDFDWEMWRYTMYRWAREHGMHGFARTHLFQIVKKNPQWYILPHCMCFYLMGIEEWLAYPEPAKLQVFKTTRKTHWKKMPPGQQKMDKNDFITCMQGFAFEFRRVPRDFRPFNALTFDGYARAMHDLTRPYGKIKARIEALEAELRREKESDDL